MSPLFDPTLLEVLLDVLFKGRKRGPLAVRAEVQGEKLLLFIQNQGKPKVKLAAVEARDGNQKRLFPQTDMAVQSDFVSRQVLVLTLDIAELREMDCRRLMILDTQGTSWPVEGFDENTLGKL